MLSVFKDIYSEHRSSYPFPCFSLVKALMLDFKLLSYSHKLTLDLSVKFHCQYSAFSLPQNLSTILKSL